MEALANNNKKKNKLPARHGHLEESIVRHKAHITRLEQMLRLLDNEVGSRMPVCHWILVQACTEPAFPWSRRS